MDMMKMLKMAIASLPQVFVCIDALDEFLPKCLPELLESEGYCSGVPQHENIPHREAPCHGRYSKIFRQPGCDTHQP